MRGGEKVLEVLCELFPSATLFTLLHNEGSVSPIIENLPIKTSFLQHLPFKQNKYRYYLPLFPVAIESFDLRAFDFVFSTSHAVAKGAIAGPKALHLCYCHTPMRYVWEQYDEYFGKERAGIATRTAMRLIAPRIRAWDVKTSSRVHSFIANSDNVARRIQAYYGRTAEVIHAPVDTRQFPLSMHDEGYFLMVTALVPYKRVDLAIEAFRTLGRKLVIVGNGPEEGKLKRIAGPDVKFLGWQSDAELAKLYAGCKALIFPGVEDFGIVPLEAMSCGKPVVAYGVGGALETVVDGRTGVFFSEQTSQALLEAVKKMEHIRFDAKAIRKHAQKFDRSVFKERIRSHVENRLQEYSSQVRSLPNTL